LFAASPKTVDPYDLFQLPPANQGSRYFEHHPYDLDPQGYVFDECSTHFGAHDHRFPPPLSAGGRDLLDTLAVDAH
jgi:hypothetical protein